MRLSSFPDLLCWCHFPKWIFAEGRSTRSPWCLEKVQGPVWCPRIILWWRAFPRMSKTMNFKHPTIWWDRKLETLGLFRRRIWRRVIKVVLRRQYRTNCYGTKKIGGGCPAGGLIEQHCFWVEWIGLLVFMISRDVGWFRTSPICFCIFVDFW